MNITRRGLLTGIGAGLAGMKAGAGYKKLIPFVLPPDDIIPGVATWYASACRECPAGCGVLLRNREGRVVKIEGNPLHPINQGKLCARGQAALQGLYDPDRIPAPRRRTASGEWQDTTWEDALRELGVTLRGARRVGIISDLQTGALGNLLQWWVVASGGSPGEPLAARGSDYLIYEPLNYEPLRTACEAVFVRKGIPDYRIDRADFLISFGADFLETWLSPVQLTRRFAEMRQVRAGKRARFVYVGPRRSPTATRADRYIQVAPGAEWLAAQAMLAAMGRGGDVDAFAAQAGVDAGVIRQLAREFQEAKAPLALGGSALPVGEDAAATAAVMLQRARFSSAIDHDRPHALSGAATMAETRAFLQRAAAGEFDTILILNANPVYSLPPDLKAAEALGKAKTVICLNTVEDETVAQVGTWALPINAPAESWGDYEPQAGIHTLMQPAMGTYFQSREAGDVLVQLARAAGVALSEVSDLTSFYDYLRYRWQGLQPQVGNTARLGRSQGPGIGAPGIGNTRLASGAAPLSVLPDADTLSAREGGRPMAPETGISNARYPDDFETFWRKSVQEGGLTLPGSPARFADVFRRPGDSTALGLPTPPAPGLKLHVHPSLAFYDGRSANRSWLQEMPDPMTRAVWDSWVELHPETARALGVQTGDRVRLTTAAGSCETAAFVWDGVAKETAALATGQGHTAGGRTARGVGVNAFALLSAPETTPDAKPSLPVKIEKVAGAGELVRAHGEQRQHGREIVQTIALSSLAIARPDKVHLPLPQGYEHEHDVYKGHDHPAHRWAMAVDLDRCNGCNACVVACYAENNIPVVGKKEVGRRHEQPWIRIDRYDEGEGAQTRSAFQPMLCQHCDSAPCETVCPAYATVHSPEGLNEQVYNRCVGTRYCANNCPYKARRFNWFNPEWPEPLPLQLNPDVTVRSRGVMEKCTFCVQRIKEVTIRAKAEARPVKDGEITPACAQTCPAEAIVFGDLMDHGSRIARIVAEDPRRYQVLRELNTKPAVFYRKRIVDGD